MTRASATPRDAFDTPDGTTLSGSRDAWDSARVTSAPSLRPHPVADDPVVVTDTAPETVADLLVVSDASHVLDGAAPLEVAAPPTPASPAAGETHAPVIVTRLVVVGLLVVSVAVVLSAFAHGRTAATIPAVPESRAAASKPLPPPTTVHVLGAQRSGDVVLLRVDPVGQSGQRSVVVEPGASVVLTRAIGSLPSGVVTLQEFLDAAGTSAVRQSEFSLDYDAAGAVRSIAITPAG